jgi:hypothetical protein
VHSSGPFRFSGYPWIEQQCAVGFTNAPMRNAGHVPENVERPSGLRERCRNNDQTELKYRGERVDVNIFLHLTLGYMRGELQCCAVVVLYQLSPPMVTPAAVVSPTPHPLRNTSPCAHHHGQETITDADDMRSAEFVSKSLPFQSSRSPIPAAVKYFLRPVNTVQYLSQRPTYRITSTGFSLPLQASQTPTGDFSSRT